MKSYAISLNQDDQSHIFDKYYYRNDTWTLFVFCDREYEVKGEVGSPYRWLIYDSNRNKITGSKNASESPNSSIKLQPKSVYDFIWDGEYLNIIQRF